MERVDRNARIPRFEDQPRVFLTPRRKACISRALFYDNAMRAPPENFGLLLGAATAALLLAGCQKEQPRVPPQPITALAEPGAAPDITLPSPWRDLVFPTAQTRLLEGDLRVFMPTLPQRPESGLFGSVRTGSKGQARFHEGVDIAPLQRDRRGEPTDVVRAVAGGTVAYVSDKGGNSNYGKYVVVLHRDPLGMVYTLYAHLASVAVRPGQAVPSGTPLGVMGHTSSSALPRARAHVHFEVGLLHNERYAPWYRAQKRKPDHGNFHGGNLAGVDPLVFLRWQRQNPEGSFRDFLATQPAAFEVVVVPAHAPDFFRRYPALWAGAAWRAGAAIVLSCAENGLVLKGRLATALEHRSLGRAQTVVLTVHTAVLGRNGSQLITQGRRGWALGQNGERWLSALLY